VLAGTATAVLPDVFVGASQDGVGMAVERPRAMERRTIEACILKIKYETEACWI